MMNKPLLQEELGEQLCNHCPLEDSQKGTRCHGGEPVMCIDSGCCEKAYEIYLEEFEEENKEMDNLEKAKEANELASKITNHKDNVRYLNKELDSLNKNSQKPKIRLDGANFNIVINTDEDLIKFMISTEINRTNILENELDQLLNGDVNRIKEMLNKGGEE